MLEGNLLFLNKFFQFECRIAEQLKSRNRQVANVDHIKLKKLLNALFYSSPTTHATEHEVPQIDWQLVAAYQALVSHLTIITGGPGTGKTTTVFKILNVWSSLQINEVLPGDIRLAAPTGKAAMRLSESLARSAKTQENTALTAVDGTPSNTPERVVTLHRLLGYRPQDNSYRHNASNPLRVKLLIVDEVSMLDLAMMDRLLAAIPSDCQLVLIGDPNQLPSVEAGNALMDICYHATPYTESFAQQVKRDLGLLLPYEKSDHGLANAICRLTRSYRFSDTTGIGKAARAILDGSALTNNEDVVIEDLTDFSNDLSPLLAPLNEYLAAVDHLGSTPDELIRLFESSRILCPVREGPRGVLAINTAIEQRVTQKFQRHLWHSNSQNWLDADRDGDYYHGRPIMILRNDYHLGLFNGDIGICVMSSEKTGQGVAFRKPDGEIEIYPIARLPQHETCFAMTIHKAQGSEFNHVSLVLSSDLSLAQQSLMTRELLYTAVTRSRKSVTIFGNPHEIEDALLRRIMRSSGLGSRLETVIEGQRNT
jgi:exodeoxyribonuclease V alpha subunit